MAGKAPRTKTPAADQASQDPQSGDQNTQQAPGEVAAASTAATESTAPAPAEGAGAAQSSSDTAPEPVPEPTPEPTPEATPEPGAAESTSPIAELLGGAVGDFIRHASHCVIEERVRQIVEEGHSPADDLAYSKYQLERAAVGYVGHAAGLPRARLDLYWPFHPSAFKPGATRRQTLVKAGALILAAIEAIDRAEDADS